MINFKHINDVWDYLDQFKTFEGLDEAFGVIPAKFGDFEIANLKSYEIDGYFEICNSYWDDNMSGYEYDYHTIEI